MTNADRFVDLACLTYGHDESRARRAEASELLARHPELVHASAHAAAAAGDVDALRGQLGGVSALGPRGWVPLLALCYSRAPQRDAVACLDLLLAHGADPNAHTMITECRFTALTGVIGEGEAGPFEQPPHPQARALAEKLLDAGASANDSQALYNTHFLPSNEWLELLLARGLSAETDIQFVLGQAAQQGFADRVQLLLGHDASPDGVNHYNRRTHVENALLEGHANIARMLIAAGAKWPALSAEERFRVAVLANDATEALRILATTPLANEHAATLIAAARHGHLAALRLALHLGVPIDGTDRGGLTALHHAAQQGHLDVVRELVAQGASVDVRDPTYDGTALGHAQHFAARWPGPHRAEIVAFLAERAG